MFSSKVREKSIERTRYMLPVFLAAVLSLTLGTAAGDDVKEFDEANVFIEINATDGDAGFQGIVDGEAWKRLKLIGPDGRKLYNIKVSGSLKKQGLTEIQWESDEPVFGELPLSVFLDRFPEGDYTFRAKTIDKDTLVSTVELTHNLPAGPTINSPMSGDMVDSDANLTVSWVEVTQDFQGGPLDSDIVGYKVTIEFEGEIGGVEVKEVLNIDVPADEFSTVIPAAFLKPGREYKVEIGAVEESGNSTFTELEFETDE